MFKKVTTDIKAAIGLIVTENATALRGFRRNLTNSIFKSTLKQRNEKQRDNKESVNREQLKC